MSLKAKKNHKHLELIVTIGLRLEVPRLIKFNGKYLILQSYQ